MCLSQRPPAVKPLTKEMQATIEKWNEEMKHVLIDYGTAIMEIAHPHPSQRLASSRPSRKPRNIHGKVEGPIVWPNPKDTKAIAALADRLRRATTSTGPMTRFIDNIKAANKRMSFHKSKAAAPCSEIIALEVVPTLVAHKAIVIPQIATYPITGPEIHSPHKKAFQPLKPIVLDEVSKLTASCKLRRARIENAIFENNRVFADPIYNNDRYAKKTLEDRKPAAPRRRSPLAPVDSTPALNPRAGVVDGTISPFYPSHRAHRQSRNFQKRVLFRNLLLHGPALDRASRVN